MYLNVRTLHRARSKGTITSIGMYLCTLKGLKTEWVQVWANSICFAIYGAKSKQTYETSETITMTW